MPAAAAIAVARVSKTYGTGPTAVRALCASPFAAGLRRRQIELPGPGETPTAYAARAGRLLPQAADAIAAIALSYLRARYESDSSGAALSELKSRVGDFRLRYARASR